MIFALKVLVCVLAVALGLYLGRPGRYSQPIEDIEDVMDRGGSARRSRAKRSLSPVAWLQRQPEVRSARRERGFNVERPGNR